jgi:1,2-diacylglycerol 3-alpha-glucosyltransferase
MKVVMLCEFFNEELEYQENLLVKYYRKHGIDVTVIASTVDSVFDYYGDKHELDKPTRIYEHNGAKVIKLKYRSIRFRKRLRWYEDITPILEDEKPDLIYLHDIMLNLHEAIGYIKRNPGCKMIMDYHGDYSNSAQNWLSLKVLHGLIRRRLYLNPARRYLSKIFPIVPAGFVFLDEVYKVPASEMELLPLGGDYDRAQSVLKQVDRESHRARLGIGPDDVVVFTGGRFNPIKQTHLLLEAMQRLSLSNVHLLVAGRAENDDYQQRLESIVADNKNVHLLGWQKNDRIYELMAISDLALFPASQSILWQQAICMHLPLVVGDTGGQSVEYLNANKSIITLPADQIRVDRIEAVLRELCSNHELRQEMKNGAIKSAEQLLNWNKLIYKTLQFNHIAELGASPVDRDDSAK